MTEHPRDGSTDHAAAIGSAVELALELCVDLFPAVDPRRNLPELVSAWCRLTRAGTVHGALVDALNRKLWIATTVPSSVTAVTLELEPVTVESIAAVLVSQTSSTGAAVRIPVQAGDTLLGCMLLESPAVARDSTLVEQLTLLTAALMRQLTEPLLAARLEQAKLEAMAEFAAGAGHEINNPVATISGRTQLLLRHETDPQRRQALLTIGGQARRIRDMIGDAMLFARPPAPVIERVQVEDAVQEVCRSVARDDAEAGSEIRLTIPSELQVAADPVQFRVAVQALLENALQADPGGQPIEVVAESHEGIARIRIIDRGPGFSPGDREHAFDPFYSGREAGRGLGFGLAKCWRIVSNHGGRIEIDSQPSEPTTLTVYWPLPS